MAGLHAGLCVELAGGVGMAETGGRIGRGLGRCGHGRNPAEIREQVGLPPARNDHALLTGGLAKFSDDFTGTGKATSLLRQSSQLRPRRPQFPKFRH